MPIVTEPAVCALAAARDYIAQDNPRATDRQVRRGLVAVTGLLQFPEIARSGRRRRTRGVVVSRTLYSAACRIAGDTVEILRVMHTRRRWPEHL